MSITSNTIRFMKSRLPFHKFLGPTLNMISITISKYPAKDYILNMYMYRVIVIPSDLDIQVILKMYMFRVIAIPSDLDIQVILNMYMFRVIAVLFPRI